MAMIKQAIVGPDGDGEQVGSSSSSSSSESESEVESEDDCPLRNRVDNHKRASRDDRRQVYMWTYSRAPEHSREDVATKVTAAYEAAGVRIQHYSIFRERHESSRSELERQDHFHCIVQADDRHRWRTIARELRQREAPMHCSAAGTGRSVYWNAFAYCYVPSSKKPRHALDSCYLLSPGHPDILARLVKERQPKRVKPLELGKVVREQEIRNLDQFYSFAKRQASAGDDRWLTVAYGTAARKLSEQVAAVWAVETSSQRLQDSAGPRESFDSTVLRFCEWLKGCLESFRIDVLISFSLVVKTHIKSHPSMLVFESPFAFRRLTFGVQCYWQYIFFWVYLMFAAGQDRSCTHIQMLANASAHPCVCGGRAIPGWEHLLQHNQIDSAAYRQSVVRLFQSGGGKGFNHFYYGAPSSGKTALTRPILALFKQYAMLKPQVGTSFPLHSLINKKALVWNDFRFPHPPLSWGDLLNILDSEPFLVGVPKGGEGVHDYMWNLEGDESVIVFMTAQHPIQGPTHLDTSAWDTRFASMLHFPNSLPSPDPAFKKIFSCTFCYSKWVLQHDASGPRDMLRNMRSRSAAGEISPDPCGQSCDIDPRYFALIGHVSTTLGILHWLIISD